MGTTISVPLDGSSVAERALGPAISLARATDATIQLIRVVNSRVPEEPHNYLEQMAKHLDFPNVTSTVIESDWPAEAIFEATTGPDSLVCLSTHGSGGIRRVLFGSVAEDILRMCPTPVLVVGPELTETTILNGGRMVICSDGSNTAEAIIPTARRWCGFLDLEPWLTVVIRSETGRGNVEEPDREVAETNYVRALAEDFDPSISSANWEVLHGARPADAIVNFADRLPAELIAMATHGRTGLARVTLGSVAMDVVRQAHCPVLMLRPSDLTEC